MKNSLLAYRPPFIAAFVLFASLAFHSFASADQTTPPFGIRDKTPNHRAFTNAKIVVSPTATIEKATLLVRDGRVIAVGASVTIPADAEQIDMTGKTIYPGLIDPFTEYGLSGVGKLNAESRPGSGPKYDGTRSGADYWNDAVHAERTWVNSFSPDKTAAESFLKLGFTTVQSGKMDGIFRGQAFVADLSDELANDAVIKSSSRAFASFDKGSSEQEYPSSLMGSIALIRQAFLDADWYAKARAALAKNPGQPLPEFSSAIAALAASTGPIVFESDDELSLLRAALISTEFGRPFIHIGSNFEYTRLAEIAAVGQPIILPLVYPKKPDVTSFERELDVSLADLRHWERAPFNPGALEKAGVTFAFTTHRLKEKSEFWSSIRAALKRGLSSQKALAALTTVPAELCGAQNDLGTLEKGKLANFIIVDGDLFSDTTAIQAVWIRGKLAKQLVSPSQIDFRGEYSLSINGQSGTLSLSGKIASVKGKIKKGESKIDLSDIALQQASLSFTAKTDSFGLAGESRFSLHALGEKFSGSFIEPNGDRSDLALARTSGFTPEPDTAKKEPAAPPSLISKLTFPNIAFGYDALPKTEGVLIKNATIWTSDSAGILASSDLLVQNGKISKIGKGLTAPAGVRTIDATGKHLTAGIIDEHSHIAISRGVNEGSHAVTAEVRIGDVINSDDINTYRALAGGVTQVQCLHGSANPIGGQAQVIKLRWGMAPEQMKNSDAPPSIKFALGENVKQSNWGDRNTIRYPQTRMGVETIMEDGFQTAREYEADWKRYRALSKSEQERTVPPRRDIQIETLLEILNSQRFIHCHSYVQTEILMLMRLAEQLGFRVQTFTHILEGYKVADEMAAHGTTASSFSDWWAYKFEVYDAIPQNPCLMHDRGVVTSINSDSPEMGRRLNQEAAKSVMYCGMSREDAIKLVTLNPAIQLKIDKKAGSLAVGKDADFVIWNNDPLSIYAAVEQTWIDGACYFSLEKDAALREANRIEKQALIQKVLKDTGSSGSGPASGTKQSDDWDCEDVVDVWSIDKGANRGQN